jgi:hypothetical protein
VCQRTGCARVWGGTERRSERGAAGQVCIFQNLAWPPGAERVSGSGPGPSGRVSDGGVRVRPASGVGARGSPGWSV